MESRHVPVLLPEVLALLDAGAGMVVADLTLGGGGYSAALLERGARVVGLDLDPRAIAGATSRLASHGDRFTARQAAFSQLGVVLDELELETVDGICMDLGLSSDQLDDAGRGFAYRLEGPLDLRFDPSRGEAAWRRIAESSREQIQLWLQEFGEVRRARRIADALHEAAHAGRLHTTNEARETILSVLPRRQRPEAELARVFQAFRILVNDELRHLDSVLEQIPDRLAAGGRFAAVSYHSLEDRRVKRMLQRESRGPMGSRHLPATDASPPRLRVLTRKAVRPSEEEIARNPRARSARLRGAERLDS